MMMHLPNNVLLAMIHCVGANIKVNRKENVRQNITCCHITMLQCSFGICIDNTNYI
jgi:hypothetical protein